MVVLKVYQILIGLSFFVNVAFGWFETCDKVYVLSSTSPTLQINSPNYPNYKYNAGSSCKYYVSAPVGNTIELSCSINLDTPIANCGSQKFYISRDGDKNLGYSEIKCGNESFVRTSVGNEIAFGYTSNIGASGYFSCNVRMIPRTTQNCDCGWGKNSKIVGGTVASPNEFVSMVGLVDSSKTKPDFYIFCGGAIISEYYVLTAAHCFNSYLNGIYTNLSALVGDHNISGSNDTPYPALYKIQSVIKHNLYVPTSNNQANDIALVKTTEIRYKRTVGPVCLPYIFMNSNTYFNDKYLTVPGWGATEFSGPSSDVLRKVSLKVMSTCASDKQICTFSPGMDSCQRDSGGTLYHQYGKQYTIGIVSYGVACASNTPSTNTRVTSYVGWIEANTNGAFFCRI